VGGAGSEKLGNPLISNTKQCPKRNENLPKEGKIKKVVFFLIRKSHCHGPDSPHSCLHLHWLYSGEKKSLFRVCSNAGQAQSEDTPGEGARNKSGGKQILGAIKNFGKTPPWLL